MSAGKRISEQRAEAPTVAVEAEVTGTHTPRRLTLAENVILTIKVLAGFALVGAALWGLNLWISAK